MNRYNPIHLLTALLLGVLGVLLSGCETNAIAPSEDNTRTISFGSQVSATRALIEDLSALQTYAQGEGCGIGVFGSKKYNNDYNDLYINTRVWYDQTSTDPDTKWTYSPTKYWDVSSGVTYDFCAYAPYKAQSDGVTYSNFAFSYTVPQWQPCTTADDQAAAIDLIVSENRNDGRYEPNNDKCAFPGGIVKFSFQHKLAKVTVNVYKDATVSATKVTEVVIGGNGNAVGSGEKALTANQNAQVPGAQNITYSRNYHIKPDKDEYSAASLTASGVKVFENASGTDVTNTPTALTTYLVAPFSLAAGNTIPVVVKYKSGEATEATTTTVASTLTGFDANKEYNINIRILAGAGNVITTVIDIQDWGNAIETSDDVYNW